MITFDTGARDGGEHTERTTQHRLSQVIVQTDSPTRSEPGW